MKHYDEDQLQRAILELLDPVQDQELRQHLEQCPDCNSRYLKIKGEVHLLKSYEPVLGKPLIPLPRPRKILLAPLLKAAAILIVGFTLGFSLSYAFRPQAVLVVEQRLAPQTAGTNSTSYMTCEDVDMNRLRSY